MSLTRVFPRVLAVCFVLCLPALTADAQNYTRPRQVADPVQATTTTEVNGRARLENDLVVVPQVRDEEDEPAATAKPRTAPLGFGRVERVMLEAIEERLGTPYRLGTEGPYRFDCSGFVWSVFQEVGIDFERGTARSLWSLFYPAGEDEKYKFGTLVFFNNLHHVGIVADEEGFYHASSSRGVVYSRFNDYWSRRISGFRRVPLAQTFIAAATR